MSISYTDTDFMRDPPRDAIVAPCPRQYVKVSLPLCLSGRLRGPDFGPDPARAAARGRELRDSRTEGCGSASVAVGQPSVDNAFSGRLWFFNTKYDGK